MDRISEALSKRWFAVKYLFSANPGRSGSGYLAQLLATCDGIDAGHERLPTMAGPLLRRVTREGLGPSRGFRRLKVAAIHSEVGTGDPATWMYADTSHLFVKVFADVVLDALPPDDVIVVVLRRRVIDVIRSMYALDEFGLGRVAWHDFLPAITEPGCEFRIDIDEVQSQFDLIIGGMVDVDARTERLRRLHPDVTWVDADLASLTTLAGAAKFLASIGARPVADALTYQAPLVNQKTSEKAAVAKRISPAAVEERLDDFLTRFGHRPEVVSFRGRHGLA